ncbi:hypothetical protein EDB86DRAFT_3064651 [Lactarius hatsudake]|nr:hypothetical protein EDB86DRAFT_3064651 [Lactarius hatsudake]
MDVDTDDRVSDANTPNTEETPSQTQQDGAPFVELFPFGAAGTPISDAESVPGYQALRDELGPDNTWYPFQSQRDWDFARWAKTRGPSSTAVTELLAIDGVVENLGLSYRNVRELNRIIDEEMPGRPRFKCEEVRIAIPCICALFGDPKFSRQLIFAPERHYQDVDHTVQVTGEMHTGKWWWSVQLHRPGATVIPVIISSDKTQLTLFRSKSAYPIYLSIGNIPKDIRCKPTQQAQVLIGYIPTTRLGHIKNKAAQRRALANLFHSCMRKCLSPIEFYGETGIAMATGDGIWYRCHPIFATFIGDYPEQWLVACTYNGRCPKCIVPRDELGGNTTFPLRNHRAAVNIFSLSDGDPTIFHRACHEVGLKPTYHPFWERLPFANIFLSITPDILHQLHQGVLKHLVRWCNGPFGPLGRLPLNHNARHFPKGITWLSKLTGQEHKDISRIILGVVVDIPLPGSQSSARFKLTRTVRALLDFIYLSQYPDIFIELGVREHFNIPKLHSLLHYTRSISLFGAADNYNTEHSERLHIDLTKNAYRATNFKDEYKQMTTWLECQEALHQHAVFIEWCKGEHSESLSPPLAYPRPNLTLYPFMATHPSEKGVTFDGLFDRYGAADFQDAIADFIVQHNDPGLSAAAAWRRADNTLIPFRRVSVFHKVKFANHNHSDPRTTVDVLHIRPEARNCHGNAITPGRFDTALVKHGSRFRVVQIRVVFQLPKSAIPSIFTSSRPAPTYLAYVEWFSPPSAPDESHGMYQISRTSIIPLEDVCRSVQLFPVFGSVLPQQWQGSTMLEECRTFYINPFLDRHLYQNLDVINERL